MWRCHSHSFDCSSVVNVISSCWFCSSRSLSPNNIITRKSPTSPSNSAATLEHGKGLRMSVGGSSRVWQDLVHSCWWNTLFVLIVMKQNLQLAYQITHFSLLFHRHSLHVFPRRFITGLTKIAAYANTYVVVRQLIDRKSSGGINRSGTNLLPCQSQKRSENTRENWIWIIVN